MEEVYLCVSCNQVVTRRQHAISCDSCNRWQHRKCDTGICLEDYRLLMKGKKELNFVCTQCLSSEEPMETDDEAHGNFTVVASFLSVSTNTTTAEDIDHQASMYEDDIRPTLNATYVIDSMTAYEAKDEVYRLLKKTFALPLLPEDDIRPAFDKLKEKSATSLTDTFFDYVDDTWLKSTIWPINTWSQFGRSVRTNNDCEGWHNKLNRRAKKGNLPFYLLIQLLYQEAKDVKRTEKLVKEQKMKRIQTKTTRKIEGKLWKFWENYNKKELTTSALLDACANIYGPVE